ncbi:MAG TPA: amidohydrolase family protein [Thermoleophilaceae bacterium]|nr:amidohydrolase family protein [Thermoleophilaceae bacterium]
MATSYDVHQHLWPDPVLRVLETRASAPRAVWRHNGRWEVRLEAEPAFEIDPADHDPPRRVERLAQQGVDRALVAMSSPVGAEVLLSAVSAWNESGTQLPGELGWWAAVPHPLAAGRAELAREALNAGAAGVCLPAGELSSPRVDESLGELLELLEGESAPLFVHPGPPSAGSRAEPAWWYPSTSYVAQQQAAWQAFHAAVRPVFPRLRAIFALLGGLAPLHAERTAARGGPGREAAVHDELCFYDTSSYGPHAVRAMATVVGVGQLVYGTDHPVAPGGADPTARAMGDGIADIVRRGSVARALGYTWVPA